MTGSEVVAKLFSECGLIAVLGSIIIVWLAQQLAKERAARESDRAAALTTIERYTKAYENILVSNSKLEGMVASHRSGGE